jgi:hypothetical protein
LVRLEVLWWERINGEGFGKCFEEEKICL